MNSWLKEIETYVFLCGSPNSELQLTSLSRLDKSLTIAKYYGKGRNIDVEDYLNSDVVFTTYHTIAASLNQSNNIIFHIEWFRIVLDEGKQHLPRRMPTKSRSFA